MINEIGNSLSVSYKPLLTFFHQKHIHSLDCLRNDIGHWYLNCFTNDQILKLWISALSFSPYRFFTAFTVTCLINIAPVLFEKSIVNDDNKERYEFNFHEKEIAEHLKLSEILSETETVAKIISKSHEIY